MNDLVHKKCIPCETSQPPMKREDAQPYLDMMPEWKLANEGNSIERFYTFKDFAHSMKFVDAVADIAEEQGHHPDIHISYDKVRIELSTHFIHGLSENDFIVAAKIEALHSRMSKV